MILGERIDTDELIQHVQTGERSGVRVALVYFAGGQPEQCVSVCRAELQKNPDAVDVRLLLGQALLGLGQREECVREWIRVLQSRPARLGSQLGVGRPACRSRSLASSLWLVSRIASVGAPV